MNKKTYLYILIFALIFTVIIDMKNIVPHEHYECTGVVYNKFVTKQETYDANGKKTSFKLFEMHNGEQVESIKDPRVLHSNAKLNMIYVPWGFWNGLLSSFSSGSLTIYEEASDITKAFRVERYSFLFFMKDKKGQRWGEFDALKRTIFLGLPRKGNDPLAFSGKCKRTF